MNNSTGTGTGTGELLVSRGARLGGADTIASSTTLEDFAILAPGDSTGTLTFNNDLSLGEFSVLEFDLGSTGDSVVVNGALTLQGRVNLIPTPGFGAGAYILFAYNPANTFNFSGLTLGMVPAGYEYEIDTTSPGTVKLLVSQPGTPTFTGIQFENGNLVLSGADGLPGADYYILVAINLTPSASHWVRSATNRFDNDGRFLWANTLSW